MGTTADKLNKILETKEAIKQAIRDKGVYIGDYDAFAEYPDAIRSIKTGSSGSDEFFNMRTQNGTNFKCLFYNYDGSELDLSDWDTSNVTNMILMFGSCHSLSILDIRNFDMSNIYDIYDISDMFWNCNSLHTLRLDNCNNDTISKIINSTNLPTGDAWGETKKMYINPDNIDGLIAPEGWIFVDSDGNEIVPEKPVCKYCGEEGCDGSCSYCFKCDNLLTECKCESGEPEGATTYVIATFNTTDNVTIMGEPNYCWLSSYDEGNTWESNSNETRGNQVVYLKPDNVNGVQIYRLFEGCSYLTNATFIGFSNVSFNPNSDNMFNGCVSLESLDLNNINLDDFIIVNLMFNGCDNLRDLHLEGCSNVTINKIITSERFPTNAIEGVTRKIYCEEENAAGLTPPTNWVFEYIG